jgi:hypothetical protein
MKNINFKNIPFKIILAFLFVTPWVQAESGLGFDDDVQDVPATPINDYIIPAIILMILFVFYTIRKYQKKAQEL